MLYGATEKKTVNYELKVEGGSYAILFCYPTTYLEGLMTVPNNHWSRISQLHTHIRITAAHVFSQVRIKRSSINVLHL